MAGSSLRRARSPVAPKMTSVVPGTGRRSRPSTSGFEDSISAWRCWATANSTTSGGSLDGVPAELVAQRGEHLVREPAVAAGVEARVEGGGDHGRRDVVVDRVDDRPAALAGVRDMGAQVLEVVALGLEGALGELTQPGAHDRAAVPQARDLLELDREARLVHEVEALGVGLHDPVLHAVVDHLHEVAGAGVAELAPAVGRREHVEDGREALDRVRVAADHHAVADLEAPDAARGADVDVV